MIAVYTSGHRKKALPQGSLQDTYLLHQDGLRRLHGDSQCPEVRQGSTLLQIATTGITSNTECSCISQFWDSPGDLRALTTYRYWDKALQSGQEGVDARHITLLCEGWRHLHALLRNAGTNSHIEVRGANATLNTFLTREKQRAQQMEKTLRERLQAQGRDVLREHTPSADSRVEEGTYLVVSEVMGVPQASYDLRMLVSILQLDALDPYSPTLMGEASAETLTMLRHQWQEHNLPDMEDHLLHVRLDETDTPDIVEIARGVWNPGISLAETLEIARRV